MQNKSSQKKQTNSYTCFQLMHFDRACEGKDYVWIPRFIYKNLTFGE